MSDRHGKELRRPVQPSVKATASRSTAEQIGEDVADVFREREDESLEDVEDRFVHAALARLLGDEGASHLLPRTSYDEDPCESQLFVIVLAGGEGRRLRAAARKRFGRELPKQFCPWNGRCSMLEETLERASMLVPADHILVSCLEEHRDLVEGCLENWPAVRRIYQPANRDTGPGVLLPLCHVISEAPGATVIVLPSDHFVSDAERLSLVIGHAAQLAETDHERVVLLGAIPESAETEYGWMVLGHRADRPWWPVRRFKEKPSAREAEQFWRSGALWNTLILASKARPLWSLMAVCASRWTDALLTVDDETAIRSVYLGSPSFNVSKDVLECSCRNLAVLPLTGCAWSDWGTEERIERTLSRA
ncbi:MAG: NTP transferase domain-containing protein [Planctomycetes bacterium]|nr:NTP transferase domain-containing protein [Planctomycetota bacterium]